MSNQRPLKLDDLKYELQLLFGADSIVSIIEEWDKTHSGNNKFGNIVNYFKDSVYLHSRNLLNALTNEYSTELGSIPSGITSELYGEWKRALERYVTHLNQARDQKGDSNKINDKHLNEQVHKLAEAVAICWIEWITKCTNTSDQVKLRSLFSETREAAALDSQRFEKLIEKGAS